LRIIGQGAILVAIGAANPFGGAFFGLEETPERNCKKRGTKRRDSPPHAL